ncbi:MAG: acyl-CoA dehydratase activase [Firmicutes bacterium]|nr:acyl-CoA dehydratase activase [Bacillota bacterium]
MISLGLDLGSRYTKAIAIDESGNILARHVERTKPPFEATAAAVVDALLRQAGLALADVDYVTTTGFGRLTVPFRHMQVTDLTSAARGAAALLPETSMVLDIGFQSTRAIAVGPGGRVLDFKTNDKCAAGAGGFVERTARYLEVDLEDIGTLSLSAAEPVAISSICAVLAESEIINHVTEGRPVENIVRGVHRALAIRALALMRRLGSPSSVTLVGGMALQSGLVAEVQAAANLPVLVPDLPQWVAALGAAKVGIQRLGASTRSPQRPPRLSVLAPQSKAVRLP